MDPAYGCQLVDDPTMVAQLAAAQMQHGMPSAQSAQDGEHRRQLCTRLRLVDGAPMAQRPAAAQMQPEQPLVPCATRPQNLRLVGGVSTAQRPAAARMQPEQPLVPSAPRLQNRKLQRSPRHLVLQRRHEWAVVEPWAKPAEEPGRQRASVMGMDFCPHLTAIAK